MACRWGQADAHGILGQMLLAGAFKTEMNLVSASIIDLFEILLFSQ